MDYDLLADRFRRLQREWHPDKFAGFPKNKQKLASNMSARVNMAYDVLRVPHRRAKHLLHLRSAAASEEHFSDGLDDDAVQRSYMKDVKLPPDFLFWVMEFREQIEEARGDINKLRDLRQQFYPQVQNCLTDLSTAFDDSRLDDAARETSKLQYLASIQQVFDEGPDAT